MKKLYSGIFLTVILFVSGLSISLMQAADGSHLCDNRPLEELLFDQLVQAITAHDVDEVKVLILRSKAQGKEVILNGIYKGQTLLQYAESFENDMCLPGRDWLKAAEIVKMLKEHGAE